MATLTMTSSSSSSNTTTNTAKSIKPVTLEKLRPLGPLERFSAHRHHLNYYTGLAVSAYYSPPAAAAALPKRGLLYMALHKLLTEQPMLSCVPTAESSDAPYFSRIPHIDFDAAVTFRTLADNRLQNDWDLDLDSVLASEHNQGFELPSSSTTSLPPLPAWRLIVASAPTDGGFWITWIFHHALGDARSGLAFHRSLLRKLDFLCSSSSSIATVAAAAASMPSMLPCPKVLAPLPRSMEDLQVCPSPGRKFGLKTLWDRPSKGAWAGASYRVPLHTNFRSLEIPTEVVEGLVDGCRREKTSVTALLQVVVSAAILQTLKEYDKISVIGSIDMRRSVDAALDENVIGCYVSQFRESYCRGDLVSDGKIWAEARRSRQTIGEVLARRGDADTGLIGGCATNYDAQLKNRLGQRRRHGLEVSNLGVLDADSWRAEAEKAGGVWSERDSKDGWRIERALFSQSADVLGSALICSAMTVKDGPMTLGFSWQERVVRKEEVESVVGKTESQLWELSRVPRK